MPRVNTQFKKGVSSWNKGLKTGFLSKNPEQTRLKISKKLSGRVLSKGHIEKMRIRNMGNKYALGNKNNLGKRLTEEQKIERKKAFVGFSNLGTFKKGMIGTNTGKKASKETIEKLKKSHLGQVAWNKGKPYPQVMGEKNNNWKGGISSVNDKIRQSLEYKLWQDSVKNKDGNFCQKCGENRVSKIMAHHILNFSHYTELRLAINNGITFCRPCHKEFHKKYTTRNNTREQLQEFLNN